MSLKMKLIAGFAGMLAAFLCVALFNLNQVEAIQAQLMFQNEKVELKQMALELKETVQELNVIASGLEISKKVEYIPIYNEKRKQFDQMIKRIGDTATTPDQIAWRSKLISLTVDYANTFDVAAKLVQENKLPPADMDKNMEYLYNESQKQKDQIFTYVDNFYVVYSGEAQAAIESSQTLLSRTATVMITAFGLVFVAAGIIAFTLIRSFTKPIGRIQHAVRRIAEGDLRHTIGSRSKDELGELSASFDHMIERVRDMLANTQAIAASLSDHARTFHGFADETAAANSEIVRAIEEISQGAGEQAAHSEKSVYIIAELQQEMDVISGAAGAMREASSAAAGNTENGVRAMDSLQAAAAESQAVFAAVLSAMDSLQESSRQIGRIIASIQEISTQTNVLSLNASIEAARAGVHGKGFMVIADEVRGLSAQTSRSAKMVEDIIGSLESRIVELQDGLQSARGMMSVQSGKLDETKTAFDAIRISVDELSGHIRHIHEKIAFAKQKNGTLVESVQFVASIAEETAAGVEEVNSASLTQDASIRRIVSEADDISLLSQKLFREIGMFRIDDAELDAGGGAGAAAGVADAAQPGGPLEPAHGLTRGRTAGVEAGGEASAAEAGSVPGIAAGAGDAGDDAEGGQGAATGAGSEAAPGNAPAATSKPAPAGGQGSDGNAAASVEEKKLVTV
ncbi:methyl-accepting chemotaxis protein [Paenibacillus hamazuiensis]|uniref:methyl-accepting chemotaxis protein n=1 Tax=Paenibacillus hamazuiensis TaxID=2936508 RepID=UPI002010739E|nr:methyl-accepting chemotaxis protein [Paenibacillus hamazuiensis]